MNVSLTKREWKYFIDCSKRYSSIELFKGRIWEDDEEIEQALKYVKNSRWDFESYGCNRDLLIDKIMR